METISKKNYESNLDNIKSIAKLLGVEVNEPFQIQFYGHDNPFKDTWYKITENGLMWRRIHGQYNQKSNALEGLLIGKHQIVKKIAVKAEQNVVAKGEGSIKRMMQESIEAENIFNTLQATNSMTQIADIVDKLNESTAKLVLKKFIYSQGQKL